MDPERGEPTAGDGQGRRKSSAATLRSGDVLLGKYRVEKIIGEGGMGIILAAWHLQLEERVALKFLRRELIERPEAVQRFLQEARAAIRIKSEHVARVIDVNTLESGEPFIVMEYLDGEDLHAWAARHVPLPVETIAEFVLQICEAMAEAHGLGIIHRDLKPANVFVTRRADGLAVAKVLDFGISKVVRAASGTDLITKEAVAIGSPAYASPEQLSTPADLDLRSDLWSLGVILYELLGGRVPFQAENTMQTCVQVLHDPAPPLQSLRSDLPAGLCSLVERCLQKQRELRFGNVGELALALAPYAPARARSSVERIIRTVKASGVSLPSPVDAPLRSSEPIAEGTPPGVGDASAREAAPQRPGRRWLLPLMALVLGGSLLLVRWARPDWFVATTPRVFQLEGEAAVPLPEAPKPAQQPTLNSAMVEALPAQPAVDSPTPPPAAQPAADASTTPSAAPPPSSSAPPPSTPTPSRPRSPRPAPSKKGRLSMPNSPG